MSKSNFKSTYSLEQRQEESQKVLTKYPDRLPVIVEKQTTATINNIDKTKYLVPSDLTMGQLIHIIRKRIKLKASEAIFVFVNNSIPCTSNTIAQIYEKGKDEDGFLYVTYANENTFGSQ